MPLGKSRIFRFLVPGFGVLILGGVIIHRIMNDVSYSHIDQPQRSGLREDAQHRSVTQNAINSAIPESYEGVQGSLEPSAQGDSDVAHIDVPTEDKPNPVAVSALRAQHLDYLDSLVSIEYSAKVSRGSKGKDLAMNGTRPNWMSLTKDDKLAFLILHIKRPIQEKAGGVVWDYTLLDLGTIEYFLDIGKVELDGEIVGVILAVLSRSPEPISERTLEMLRSGRFNSGEVDYRALAFFPDPNGSIRLYLRTFANTFRLPGERATAYWAFSGMAKFSDDRKIMRAALEKMKTWYQYEVSQDARLAIVGGIGRMQSNNHARVALRQLYSFERLPSIRMEIVSLIVAQPVDSEIMRFLKLVETNDPSQEVRDYAGKYTK